jgi:hypothetical protein
MRPLVLVGIWTAIWIAVVLFLRTPINPPGCARLMNPPATCAPELDASNMRLWLTYTLPLYLLLVAGYVVISAVLLRRRRRRAGTRDIQQC